MKVYCTMKTMYKRFAIVDLKILFSKSYSVFLLFLQIMPRLKKKVGAGARGEWKDCNMKSAVEFVREKKMTIREAALYFDVPKSTLNDRLLKLKKGFQIELLVGMGPYFQKNLLTV